MSKFRFWILKFMVFSKIEHFLFRNKTVGQTIAKNTFWLIFGEIMGRILRTGVVIYAARVLGAECWGVFSYAITFAALFAIFSDIGLSSVLTKEAAKNPTERHRYFSTILAVKLVLIFIVSLAVLFVMPLLTKIPLSRSLVFFVVLLLIFDSLRNFGCALFRAIEKMEREALTNIVTQAVILILGLVVLRKFPSPENLALTYAIGSASGLIVAVFFLAPYLGKIFSYFDRTILKPIINAAWLFGLSGVLGAVMLNTDIIMIGWFKDATAVGFYSAAQKPVFLLYMIPSFIAGALFPSFSRFAQANNEKFRALLEKGLSIVFLLSFPFSIGLFLTSGQVINLLFGVAHGPAISVLQILSLTFITAYTTALISNAIFAYGRYKIFLGYAAIGALGNVVLNALLIPLWGISGAAVATVITQILSTGYAGFKLKRINNFSILNYLPKMIISTIIMGVSVILLRYLNLSVLAIIPIAATIYLTTLVLFKEKMIAQFKTALKS